MIKNKPKTIIFDYGNTLVHEDIVEDLSTFDTIYETLVKNPLKVRQEDLYQAFKTLEAQVRKDYYANDLEFRYEDIFAYVFEDFSLESSKDLETLSEYYFDAFAPGQAMEGAKEVLDYLDQEDLAYGIISNLSFSSRVLARRLYRLLGHDFKFVLTSCEWLYRKPKDHIFNIGLKLSQVEPDQAWYVGDNPLKDVVGAQEAGLVPVFFETQSPNYFFQEGDYVDLQGDFIKINELTDLIGLIEKIGK